MGDGESDRSQGGSDRGPCPSPRRDRSTACNPGCRIRRCAPARSQRRPASESGGPTQPLPYTGRLRRGHGHRLRHRRPPAAVQESRALHGASGASGLAVVGPGHHRRVPAEVRGVPQRGAMWRHSERIEVVASPDGLLRYPIDTSPANSGSPVWILGGGERRIQIGIHIAPRAFDPVGTRNVGTRITDRVLAQIALWCRTARVQLPTMWRSRS